MDPTKFRNSPSGRLVKSTNKDGDYWAFVPNPLPPVITFDTELVNHLSTADRKLGMLAGLGQNVPNPKLLLAPLLRREALLSSRIEGTYTTFSDLYAYEAQQLPLSSDDPDEIIRVNNAREVTNYIRAMEYGLDRLNTLPMSKRLIQELHQLLLKGVRGEDRTPGEFRRIQNAIGSKIDTLKEARFIPPPILEMNEALDKFEAYINEEHECPPLIRLAFIHYQFETIHPFLDGNGRIGRLIIPLLVDQWNLLPYPMLYLSVFFDKNRDIYYDRLLAISKTGAWRDWLFFFLDGVIHESSNSLNLINKMSNLQLKWKKQLQVRQTSANLLKLVDQLFIQPYFTIPQVAEKIGVTWKAANNMVERLEEEKIIEQQPHLERPRVYLATEIIKILE